MKVELDVNLYIAVDSHRQPIYTTEKSSPSKHQTLEQFIKNKIEIPQMEMNHLRWEGKKNPSLMEREQSAKKFKITIEEVK